MNSKELEEGLDIIFEKEKDDLKERNTFTTEEKREDNKLIVTYSIVDYPNSEFLKNLYSEPSFHS